MCEETNIVCMSDNTSIKEFREILKNQMLQKHVTAVKYKWDKTPWEAMGNEKNKVYASQLLKLVIWMFIVLLTLLF